jgi:geranylgeranyl pyrophosphate synthase
VEFATARAEELVAQARRRLADLAPSPARTSLERLGEFVLERQF